MLNFCVVALEHAWMIHNQIRLRNQVCSWDELSIRVNRLVADYWKAAVNRKAKRHGSSDMEWRAPLRGWKKINFDVVFSVG